MGRRLAAWIWYRGDAFRGFQQQPGGQTVQQTLERAFEDAGAGEVTVMPAGRTDRGVSARMQVVSFRLPEELNAAEVRIKVDRALHPGAAAKSKGHSPSALGSTADAYAQGEAVGFVGEWVEPAASFHAQWSANAREYRYRLALGDSAPSPYVWNVTGHQRLMGAKVDAPSLASVLSRAVGTRDFSAFHEKSSVMKPRTLERAEVIELGGGIVEVVLRGDSFGRHQVRYLVGTAALVAAGRLSVDDFTRALESAERIDGLRAPPEPLVLWEVLYPPEVDPFGAELRRLAPGLPRTPPFHFY